MGRTRSLATSVSLTAALMAVSAAPSASAKTTNGCPAGWDHRTVASLLATGNAPVPGQIDAAGNNDGSVCALPLPDAFCLRVLGFDPCPVATIYLFRDNDVPA